MARALGLAERGRYTTRPNPRVGCVLVRDQRVIGEGWHQFAGQGHAEVNALAAAGDARGATAYVTLEPCSFFGKTPPCSDALIQAGVVRVVAAMTDPNPRVAGAGLQRLRDAGIAVAVGLLQEQAEALNPGFIKRMRSGLPWLRAKLAMSLDGRSAMASGESQWITGTAARADVQRLRAASCAIITGVETVLHDDPALTVREAQLELPPEQAAVKAQIIARQPLRVIVDTHLRTPPGAAMLKQPGATLIAHSEADSGRAERLRAAGAQLLALPAGEDGRVDLHALLRALGERQCNEVLLECGAQLAGAMWRQQLIDQLTLYMAPVLLGQRARALLGLDIDIMADKQPLQIDAISPLGADWRIDARPVYAGHRD